MLTKEQFKVARRDILGINEENAVFDNLLCVYMSMCIMRDCNHLDPDECIQLIVGSDEKDLTHIRGVVEYASVCNICSFLADIARKSCIDVSTQTARFLNNAGILPGGCSVQVCNCLINSYL